MSKKTITWHAWELKHWPQTHPVKAWLRSQARAQGYVGIPGVSEFLQLTYVASPIVGKNHDWNGVKFSNAAHLKEFWSCVPGQVLDLIHAHEHKDETNV